MGVRRRERDLEKETQMQQNKVVYAVRHQRVTIATVSVRWKEDF